MKVEKMSRQGTQKGKTPASKVRARNVASTFKLL